MTEMTDVEPVETTDQIETKPVLDYFQGKWGVTPAEYMFAAAGTSQVDFQDLMVSVTERQALAIEKEVKPETVRVQKRTKRLKVCGDGMSELTKFKFKTESDEPNPPSEDECWISVATVNLVNELAGRKLIDQTAQKDKKDTQNPRDVVGDEKVRLRKDVVDSANQYIRTESDRLNNVQQLAMSRLETLVQGRDQNFSTAATLMNHVSETRGSTIRAFG